MGGASGRHLARQWVAQFLYQLEFNEPDELEEDLLQFWEDRKPSPNMRQFAEERIHGVLEVMDALDERLLSYTQNWRIDRFNAVDRNILRLALYELFHRDDVPPVVVLNEGIDLAKELSSDESGKFVNGILDRALKDVDRPLRN